jgi:hypothetical protein
MCRCAVLIPGCTAACYSALHNRIFEHETPMPALERRTTGAAYRLVWKRGRRFDAGDLINRAAISTLRICVTRSFHSRNMHQN